MWVLIFLACNLLKSNIFPINVNSFSPLYHSLDGYLTPYESLRDTSDANCQLSSMNTTIPASSTSFFQLWRQRSI